MNAYGQALEDVNAGNQIVELVTVRYNGSIPACRDRQQPAGSSRSTLTNISYPFFVIGNFLFRSLVRRVPSAVQNTSFILEPVTLYERLEQSGLPRVFSVPSLHPSHPIQMIVPFLR